MAGTGNLISVLFPLRNVASDTAPARVSHALDTPFSNFLPSRDVEFGVQYDFAEPSNDHIKPLTSL